MQRKLAAAAALVILVVPAGAAPAGAGSGEVPTTYTRLLDDIVAHFGFVPETALLNGVEVPTLDALTLLRENALPLADTEEVYVPPDDVGYAIRQGANGCLIGLVFTAVAFSASEALINEDVVGVPGGKIACGPGYPYSTGLAGAEVAPGHSGTACAMWLQNPGCYSGSWAANMAAHVGFVDILIITPFFTYHIEQMFCGTAGWTPGPAGTVDVCVATVQV